MGCLGASVLAQQPAQASYEGARGGCKGAGHSDGVMARMAPARDSSSADRRCGVASTRSLSTDVKRTAGDGDSPSSVLTQVRKGGEGARRTMTTGSQLAVTRKKGRAAPV